MTQREAITGRLHVTFAYPEQAETLLAELEEQHPGAVAWLYAWAAGKYDEERENAIASVPPPFKELPTVEATLVVNAEPALVGGELSAIGGVIR